MLLESLSQNGWSHPAGICRIDSLSVVIGEDVTKYFALYLLLRHPVGRNPIDQFFLQCCEEAFHSGVVEAVIDPAQALLDSRVFELIAECIARILASAIRVILNSV